MPNSNKTNPRPPLVVAWMLPGGGGAATDPAAAAAGAHAPLLHSLATLGIALVFEGPQAAAGDAPVRVLPLAGLATDAARRQAAAGDPRPTLLLAADATQTLLAHELARTDDDVARIDEAPGVLAWRLRRLVARARAQARLSALEATDALTGLPGWDQLVARSEALVGSAGAATWSLIVVDLVDFAPLNARHGRATGDQVLRAVAAGLAPCLTPPDLLVRSAGDEFAVLARRDGAAALDGLCDDLRIEVGALAFRTPDGVGGSVTARVGRAPVAKAAGLARALVAARQDARGPSGRVGARAARLVARLARGGSARAPADHPDVDPLTSAWSPAYLARRLAREMAMSRQDGRALSVLVVAPAAADDAALRACAERALATIRPVDWLARADGATLALVLPGSAADAARVADRLQRNEAAAGAGALRIGSASFAASDAAPADLLARAAQAVAGSGAPAASANAPSS